jgi:hypothetical protein
MPDRQRGEPIPAMQVYDIPIPPHPEARDAWDTMGQERCSYVVAGRIRSTDAAKAEERLQSLTHAERQCLIRIEMHSCLEWMLQQLPRVWEAEGQWGKARDMAGENARTMALGDALRHALRAREVDCAGKYTQRAHDLLVDIRTEAGVVKQRRIRDGH